MLAVWLIISSMLYSLRLSNGGSFPKPLTAREEREYLERAAQGDLEARNVLIERNLRLVAHIMKKYYTQTSDQEDLISIGTIGLIKGISTFDPKKGARLATYAARCVENAMHPPGCYFPLPTHKTGPLRKQRSRFCFGSTAQLQLRPSPDIFRRSIGLKSLRYAKYICTFQTLSRLKTSRRMLSLNRAVLPYVSESAESMASSSAACSSGVGASSGSSSSSRAACTCATRRARSASGWSGRSTRMRSSPSIRSPPRASYAGAAGLIPAASRRAPRAPRRAPLQTSGAGAWLPAAGGPSCRWQWPD